MKFEKKNPNINMYEATTTAEFIAADFELDEISDWRVGASG